jgi:hypothetical protein
MFMKKSSRCLGAVIASTTILSIAGAGELFAYHTRGRSPAQQGQDKYECHQWAVEQSKFDPVQMAAQSPAQPGQQWQQSAGNASTSGKSGGTGSSVLAVQHKAPRSVP